MDQKGALSMPTTTSEIMGAIYRATEWCSARNCAFCFAEGEFKPNLK
jgi:hypothetical protein